MLETQTRASPAPGGVNPALVLLDILILNFPEQTHTLPTQIQVLPDLGVLTAHPTSGLGSPQGSDPRKSPLDPAGLGWAREKRSRGLSSLILAQPC